MSGHVSLFSLIRPDDRQLSYSDIVDFRCGRVALDRVSSVEIDESEGNFGTEYGVSVFLEDPPAACLPLMIGVHDCTFIGRRRDGGLETVVVTGVELPTLNRSTAMPDCCLLGGSFKAVTAKPIPPENPTP